MKQQYIYEGPVMKFDSCIERKWSASTFAASEKQARNNLSYRYKKERGFTPQTLIKLPGKLELVS